MGFKLSIEQGKGRGQAFDFDAETITIGRTEENDVVLYEQGVSRKHARISVQAGKHFVEDLDSANGTLLNGAKVKREVLEEGDTIGIGAVVFRFGDAGKGGAKNADQSTRIVGEKGAALSGDTAKGPAPTAPTTSSKSTTPAVAAPGAAAKPPTFNPRYVVMGVSGALIFAIGWAAWFGSGRSASSDKAACPTDNIRLEGQSISSMVFSTTPESVCVPGKTLNFGFVGQPRTKYLFNYSAFYTEKNGVEILINGEKYKEGSPLANTRRSKPTEILIDEKQVKVGKTENVITFRTDKKQWGIERLELTPVPLDGCNLDQALEYFHLGEQLFEQKNVAAPNLYHSMTYEKKARQLMEGCEPKPADYIVVKQLIQTLNGELDSLCEHKLFYVKKQQTFGKFEAANDGYRYLLTAFPGDEHPCRSHVIDLLGGPQRVKTILGSSL